MSDDDKPPDDGVYYTYSFRVEDLQLISMALALLFNEPGVPSAARQRAAKLWQSLHEDVPEVAAMWGAKPERPS